MLDYFGSAFERAHFADAGHVFRVPLHAEFKVLVRIEALCVDGELCHVVLLFLGMPYTSICPANCWSLITTNSAGFSGAKPTTTFTIPRSMSFCVVVSLSHLTKYAEAAVVPWNAPWRNMFCINAPTFRR